VEIAFDKEFIVDKGIETLISVAEKLWIFKPMLFIETEGFENPWLVIIIKLSSPRVDGFMMILEIVHFAVGFGLLKLIPWQSQNSFIF